jgi:hypothetical protein
MSDCPATGTILLDGQEVVVICNRKPGHDGWHHDVVHGDWASTHEEQQ